MNLIIAVVLTVLLEVPVVFAAMNRYRPKHIIFNAVLVNIITNTALNLFRLMGLATTPIGLLTGEVLIVLIEAGMYFYCTREANVPMKRIFLASVAANAFSFSVGFILWGV